MNPGQLVPHVKQKKNKNKTKMIFSNNTVVTRDKQGDPN